MSNEAKKSEYQTKLQETITTHGGNIKPILEHIKTAAVKINDLEAKRDAINDDIANERSAVKAMGISKKAFDYARKREQMDPEKRDQLDTDCSIACEALGVPLKAEQGELFSTKKEKDVADKKAKSDETE